MQQKSLFSDLDFDPKPKKRVVGGTSSPSGPQIGRQTSLFDKEDEERNKLLQIANKKAHDRREKMSGISGVPSNTYDLAPEEPTGQKSMLSGLSRLEELPSIRRSSGFYKWQEDREAILRVLLQYITRQGDTDQHALGRATHITLNPRGNSEKLGAARNYLDSVYFSTARKIADALSDQDSRTYDTTIMELWDIFKDLFPHESDAAHFNQLIRHIKSLAKSSNIIKVS